MHSPLDNVSEVITLLGCHVVSSVGLFIRPFGGHILILQYLTNGLNSFDKND